MGENDYNGLIFTNHALARMKERGITRDQVLETYRSFDSQKQKKGAIEKAKKFEKFTVSVIFKQNDKDEPVILSVWIDPPIPGSADAREKERWIKYKKAGFWGKIWYTFLRQAGI